MRWIAKNISKYLRPHKKDNYELICHWKIKECALDNWLHKQYDPKNIIEQANFF